MLQYVFIGLITIYQRTLSPDHGPLHFLHPHGFCPHDPTCSEYAKQMIRERGVLRALPRIFKRLLSCHPWTQPSDAKILKTIEQHL